MGTLIDSPAVLLALTPFGDQLADAAVRRCSPSSGPLQVVRSDEDLLAQVGPALTAALNVSPSEPRGFLLADRVRYRTPRVVLLAAASELSNVEMITRLVRAVRREFRRSCLAGKVFLLDYAGPVDGHLPADALLLALDNLAGLDAHLVCTDTDALGRRLLQGQTIETAGLFLAHFLETAELQRLTVDSAGQRGQVAFGLGRVDLSDEALREFQRLHVRELARRALFAGTEEGPETPVSLEPEVMSHLQRQAGGSLGAVAAATRPVVREASKQLLAAQMRECAAETRRALLALIPPPSRKPPLTFWQRVWRFLRRILFFWRHDPPTPVPAPPPKEEPPQSPAHAERLVRAERLRVLIGWLEWALQPELESRSATRTPYEITLGELPEVRQRVLSRCAPEDAEEVVWHLTREFSAGEFLEDRTPDSFLERIDRVSERLLRLDRRQRLLGPDDFHAVLPAVTATVGPLFCGAGGPLLRLARVPGALRETFTARDYEVTTGRDGEAMFFVLEPGVSLLSLLSEE